VDELLKELVKRIDDKAAVERLARAIEDLTEVIKAQPPVKYVPYVPYQPYNPWWQNPVIYTSTSTSGEPYKVIYASDVPCSTASASALEA
jgi:hypothetical protein